MLTEAANTNFKVFGLTQTRFEPQSPACEASTLTIIQPMWLLVTNPVKHGSRQEEFGHKTVRGRTSSGIELSH